MWKDDMMQVLKHKGRGASLMVSDFIEKRDGYLKLSDDLHQYASSQDNTIPQSARVIFEYAWKEGYWNNELFLENAFKVAEAKPSSMFGSLIIHVVTLPLQMTHW